VAEQLDDTARIFTGDVAEAFADMQYAVIRDPERFEFARRVMTEAMQRVIEHYTARERKGEPRGKRD
jgi:hypothetical protein